MTKYRGFSTKVRGNRHESLSGAVGAYLRSLYPSKTAQFVAADLDCAPTTVQPWLDGRAGPSLPMIARMLDRYGPEFAAAVFGLDWLRKAAREAEIARAKAARAALDAKLERLGA